MSCIICMDPDSKIENWNFSIQILEYMKDSVTISELAEARQYQWRPELWLVELR